MRRSESTNSLRIFQVDLKDSEIYIQDSYSDGLTDFSPSFTPPLNHNIVERVSRLSNRQSVLSSYRPSFFRSSNVFGAPSLDSDYPMFEEGERFSRATFSLMSQQLLMPMWNSVDSPVSDSSTDAFTENEDQILDKDMKQLSPIDSVQFLESSLPDYFVSFNPLLTKEDYLRCVKKNDLNRIITFIHQQLQSFPINESYLISCMEKLNITDKSPVNHSILMYTLRELISIPHSSLQKSAFSLILSLSDFPAFFDLFLLFKIHIFVILSFEQSDRYRSERELAFSIITKWVTHYCASVPYSLIISIKTVASEPSDFFRLSSLQLLLRLLLENPREMIRCDCTMVLLQGALELENHSLLQSVILACLYFLNNKSYRQSKVLLDFQIIIDPLLFDGITLQQKPDSPITSFYVSHIGLLTLMRSWTGLVLFCSDVGGFNTYINILATRADDYPELAKEILLFLFTLLGIPSPNLLNEDEKTVYSSFWNECSLFINHIGFITSTPSINLLTTYLSLLVVVCMKAKLPECLISLLQHSDHEIVFLAKCLLSSFTLLSNLFIPITNASCGFVSQSFLMDQEDPFLRQRIPSLSSPSIHLYPIIQHTTVVRSELLDYFSWISLFNSILDSFSDNTYVNNPLFITDYICNSNMINHDLLSQTLHGLYNNQEQFSTLLRKINKQCSDNIEQWDWSSLFTLLVITASCPHFINEFAKTKLMSKMEAFFAPSSDEPPFLHLPITKESGLILCCGVILIFAMLNADTQLISRQKKELIIHRFMRSLMNLIESTPEYNTGQFSTLSLRYTNAYYYAVIAIHFLFSPRLQKITNLSGIQQSFYALVQNPSLYLHNSDFLFLFINHIHLLDQSNDVERLLFSTMFEKGDLDIKRGCLNRIRIILSEHIDNEDFIIWSLPLVCDCLGICESLTLLAVAILDDIITLTPLISIVAKTLLQYHSKVAAIISLTECEEFLTRLMSVEDGFTLLEDVYNYISNRFDFFMESGIYAYVRNMENEFTAGLLQNPSNSAVASFYLDNDSSLLVNPLRMQPPQNELNKILKDDRIALQWFLEIPWRIESVLYCREEEIRLNVDCGVDFTAPHLHAVGEDSVHSVVHLRGTFTHILTNSISTVELQEGDELRVCLQVGCEAISHNYLGCEFQSTHSSTLHSYQKYVSSAEYYTESIRNFALHPSRNPPMETISWNDLSTLIAQRPDNSPFIHRVCNEGSCIVWECQKDPKTNHILVYAVEFIIELVPQKPRPVIVHPHFIGSLFQTNSGISFLKSRMDVVELCKIISDENETLSNRRAVLWSIAHIAIHSDGLVFLKEECDCDFIDIIISLALHCPVLSLRGTAFLSLSFLSSSPAIRPILQDKGWFCECYSGSPVCYPLQQSPTLFTDISTENRILPLCTHFHSNKEMKFEARFLKPLNHASAAETVVCPSDLILMESEITKEEETVLNLISSLASVVLCQEGRKKLTELRILNPDLFTRHRLFMYVQHLLSVISLSRGWRWFVMDLFSEIKWSAAGWKEFDKFPLKRSKND